jgi:hypothetical protein
MNVAHGISSWADFLAAPWWVKLTIVGAIVLVLAFLIVPVLVKFRERHPKIRRRERELREHGKAAMATVLSTHETVGGGYSGDGVMPGHQDIPGLWKVTLRVMPDDEPAFEATIHAFLMDNKVPEGDVPVLYDPSDRRKVVLDHSVEAQNAASARQEMAVGAQIAADRIALAGQFQQMQGSRVGPVPHAADLVASGQRVQGVLMSFAANGDSTDSTYSRPELRGAPYYILTVELHIPKLAPMTARNIQPVPPTVVPSLALGLQLTCAVDPANPAHIFAVDWAAPAP